MQIILLENVANLGKLGDLVNVKSGFARNFLVPQGKATIATEDNIAKFESRRVELEKASDDKLQAAQARAKELEGQSIEIASLASEEGKLFGSISVFDIADAFTSKGLEMNKSEVRLPEGPLKDLGEHQVEVSVHTEVVFNVTVNIIPE
jgi:large subunit ribosomal protein L9